MEENTAVVKRILLVLAVLSIVDVALGTLFYLFLNVGFFSEKSSARIASDLAFLEGAVTFCVGSVVAFFSSSFSLRKITLIVIGAAMMGISVVFGLFA